MTGTTLETPQSKASSWNEEALHHRKHVKKLQRRIAKAAEQGDGFLLHHQHQLLNSHDARFTAVDKVARRNKGSSTPGVDGEANLSDKEKFDLVDQLDPFQAPQSLRGISIPKEDGTSRPLAIPTMHDRAVQELFKSALLPVWEPKLEALPASNSGGLSDATHPLAERSEAL